VACRIQKPAQDSAHIELAQLSVSKKAPPLIEALYQPL
jgi:hypothetical protein